MVLLCCTSRLFAVCCRLWWYIVGQMFPSSIFQIHYYEHYAIRLYKKNDHPSQGVYFTRSAFK